MQIKKFKRKKKRMFGHEKDNAVSMSVMNTDMHGVQGAPCKPHHMAEEECMEAELWTGPLNSART
jgi:hypothetical protein